MRAYKEHGVTMAELWTFGLKIYTYIFFYIMKNSILREGLRHYHPKWEQPKCAFIFLFDIKSEARAEIL